MEKALELSKKYKPRPELPDFIIDNGVLFVWHPVFNSRLGDKVKAHKGRAVLPGCIQICPRWHYKLMPYERI